MSNLIVDIKGKTYPSRTPGQNHVALEPVNFTISESQFTCLVGPSGCGKTTLLNIVGGLEKDIEGKLTFDDKPLHEAHLGYMFQNPRLMPWLSVRENVEIVLENEKLEPGLAAEILEIMGLGDVMEAYPNRLSGGMQRRVALARAFVIKPSLLLMDEPFISLDRPSAEKLRLLLLEIWNARPTTVLFVTHDLDEALLLADRILFLSPSPGRIVLDFPVPLSRPRAGLDPSTLHELRRELLATHPDLLAGLAAAKSPD